jgi:hypothetical protein
MAGSTTASQQTPMLTQDQVANQTAQGGAVHGAVSRRTASTLPLVDIPGNTWR